MTRREGADRLADDPMVVPVRPITRPRLVDIERVYDDHFRDVHRYLLALTRSPEDADEIAAETFERAIRTWSRVPEPALPWLLLTGRRIATDRWRRARRLARIAIGSRRDRDVDAGDTTAEFWLWFDALSIVLTERQREVLILRYQRDLTDADIASIMSLSASGVRSLAARALDALRGHPELLR